MNRVWQPCLKTAPVFFISFYTNDKNSFSNFVFIYVLFLTWNLKKMLLYLCFFIFIFVLLCMGKLETI